MANPAQPKNLAAKDLTAKDLPEWDLSDLYQSMEDPRIGADLQKADEEAKTFATDYSGRLSQLSGAEFGRAIARYEALDEALSRLGSYAQLVQAGNVIDPTIGRFYQTMIERITALSTHVLFFALEINRLDDAVLEPKLADPAAAKYRPWLRDLRAARPHQLSDELEKILHEKTVAGATAWVRLYDETLAGLKVDVKGRGGGKNLTLTDALHLLQDKRGETRKSAAEGVAKTLRHHLPTFSLVYNTLMKDKEIEDKWRRYPRPVSSRNLSNQVEDEVVDALVAAVKAAYPRTSHRYYKLKAKWLGQDQLDHWDRNAPLPHASDRSIPWNKAQDLVLKSYAAFSPALADIGKRFFSKPWIDVPARPGKASGAFAHPTVPSAHPYLLLNYKGKTRDVMTLAHELGHGVHQVLAAEQGHFVSQTPLTLAETASVFGEMLTFRGILAREKRPEVRRALLAGKVEDMLNTVVRQISFYEFERKVHDERRKGEISSERIGDIWIETMTESLGPALRLNEDYRVFWAYIPHFIHSPFYVYAYAFGDCLVNSLYALYETATEGFAEKYLTLLKSGGKYRHRELLAPFGLDASDPAFWAKGLGILEGFIDQLEAP